MRATNAEIFPSAITPAETVTVPSVRDTKKEEWIRKREADLLPCSYYHLVFTLPEELNGLSIANPTLVYKTLFEAAWATLNQFGNTEGIQLGMIAVLHTWGQNLSLHPHLHCIVPGGGTNKQGKWKGKVRTDKYLFSGKKLWARYFGRSLWLY